MSLTSAFLPWFAPKLSRSMRGVINNLGHRTVFMRGERIYESPGFFQKLMLVERGVVAKALLDPFHKDPLLISLSGPGAFCGSYETLFLQDRMQRRHWCMTTTEVVVANADLLLRICDQNPSWQRELSHYSSICAVSDRLGLLVTHSATVEERLAIFLVANSISANQDFQDLLREGVVEWVALSVIPSLRVAASVINTSPEQIREVLRQWLKEDRIRYLSHKVLVFRELLSGSWQKIQPILQTANVYEAEALRTSLPVRDLELPR